MNFRIPGPTSEMRRMRTGMVGYGRCDIGNIGNKQLSDCGNVLAQHAAVSLQPNATYVRWLDDALL